LVKRVFPDLKEFAPRMEKITNLFDYEIFARVIKAGSLSAAARELHSSPAMISKRLTRLEERLGVRLLQRTTRRLTPTQVGQSFSSGSSPCWPLSRTPRTSLQSTANGPGVR